MIEFKADCGHIIQAPDRDAGKIVKCAYCGREVEAPAPTEEPEILFQEVDLNELAKGEGEIAGSGGMTIQGQQQEGKTAPSPADVARAGNKILRYTLLVAFGAICITVLFLVTQSVVNIPKRSGGTAQGKRSTVMGTQPVPESERPAAVPATPSHLFLESERAPAETQPRSAPSRGRRNFVFGAASQGVFVEAFNKNVRIYVRYADSDNDETLGADDSEFRGTGTTQLSVPAGRFRIAVTLDTLDSILNQIGGFEELRDQLEIESDASSAEQFFARDISVGTSFIDEIGVEPRLVRYYEVEVRPGQWTLITNLFEPRGSLSTIVARLPDVDLYAFDTEATRRELSSLNVAAEDTSVVLELLARAGQVVYPGPDATHTVFEIDVRDGSLHSWPLTVSESEIARDEEQRHDTKRVPAPNRNPWAVGPPPKASSQATDEEAPQDLSAVLAAFRKRLNDRGDIDPDEWRPYFVDHEQYDLWQAADVRTRSAFVELLEKGVAGRLIEEIGGTLLDDPDIDARLALLIALVRSGSIKAVSFIEQRLEDIEEDASINPDQTNRERKALLRAKDKLRKGLRKRENPWDP
ncbi:MAG: hypothetical protein IID41_00835 [Planctomycetes bacterium]|nr:hypothetical protein [Planctomycetota bacterium]